MRARTHTHTHTDTHRHRHTHTREIEFLQGFPPLYKLVLPPPVLGPRWSCGSLQHRVSYSGISFLFLLIRTEISMGFGVKETWRDCKRGGWGGDRNRGQSNNVQTLPIACTLVTSWDKREAVGREGAMRQKLHFHSVSSVFENVWNAHLAWVPTIFILMKRKANV